MYSGNDSTHTDTDEINVLLGQASISISSRSIYLQAIYAINISVDWLRLVYVLGCRNFKFKLVTTSIKLHLITDLSRKYISVYRAIELKLMLGRRC